MRSQPWPLQSTGTQLLGNAAPPSLDGVSCHEGGPSGVLGFYVREGNRDAKIPSWNTRSRALRQGPRGPTSREGLAARIAGNSLLIAFAAGSLYFERLPQQPLRKEPERRLQYLGCKRSLLKARKYLLSTRQITPYLLRPVQGARHPTSEYDLRD